MNASRLASLDSVDHRGASLDFRLDEHLQFDAWVSFAFEELLSAPVRHLLSAKRHMLSALINNGIRYSAMQTEVWP